LQHCPSRTALIWGGRDHGAQEDCQLLRFHGRSLRRADDRLWRVLQFDIRPGDLDSDHVWPAISQACRESIEENVLTVALTCIEERLMEPNGGDCRQQRVAIVDLHVDGSVRPCGVPDPAINPRAVGPTMSSLVDRCGSSIGYLLGSVFQVD